MLIRLYVEYCGPIFIAGIGVFQAAAAYNSLNGLRFFRSKVLSYLFSGLALIPAIYYFFTWNQQRANGIIEGSQQAGYFSLSVFMAFLFTLSVSSCLNHNYFKQSEISGEGLEVMRKTTFFRAIRHRIKRRS